LLAGEQTGVDELPEVVGHGRLAQPHRVGEIAHAGLGAGVGGDQGHQPDPGRSPRALKIRARRSAATGSRIPPVTGLQQSAISSTKGAAGML